MFALLTSFVVEITSIILFDYVIPVGVVVTAAAAIPSKGRFIPVAVTTVAPPTTVGG